MSIKFIPENTAKLYPNDKLLHELNIESYFGAPLKNSQGEILGIIAIMDTKPMMIEDWAQPILGLFSNHVAMELQRKSVQEELELADSVFKKSVEAIIICSADTRILRTNPAFTRITGYSSKDAIGKTPQFLQSKAHSAAFYKDFWKSLTESGVWQGEISDRRKNGEIFPAWQTITVVRDAFGKPQQYISIFSDITDKKLSEERIYNLAHNDMLTQLPNRVAFHNQMIAELERAKRTHTQLAVMFIDLDHFKLINDTLGHPVGDELLQQAASRLKSAIRSNDTISRFGGDEFTILIPSIKSEAEASMVALKIQQCLIPPIQLEHHEITISASIGIGIYPQNGQDVATLLKNADSAMYRAKEQGRDGFQFFTEEMNQHAHDRLELESELRKALEQNDFILHYQPQINTYTGSIVGFEALIRWIHPEKGIIPPNTFIPIAEASGLIVPIGEWVLNAACQQLKEWRDQGYSSLTMSVNLSGRQFKQQDLLPTIQKAIINSGIIAAALELELTESIMMENVNETINTLSAIRNLGVQLSIDDFGTGYSSMSYLKRFPINKLKIDQSFVQDLPDDSDDAAIVKATIALAHALNMTVIAEGVETEAQFQFLKGQQCEEIQGYFFSRPLPAHELTSLLKQEFPAQASRT
ncbi:EAL domain-containing protein [Neptunomonas sp.]|uniref:putative bifunctional diguanylate cyclase/phosphodiesterase n=1 Tax=Neptunomonas sp. TaxID=1971898 RepID=UPI0025CD204D|nr:EAL domain-containing protein [Neptunomonas sp.]